MKKYKIILPILLSLVAIGCSNSKTTTEVKDKEVKTVNKTVTDKDSSSKDSSTTSKVAEEKNKTSNKKDSSNSNANIIIDVKSMDNNSTFSFGMSKDSVKSKLKDLKLEVNNEIEITDGKDSKELGNKQLWVDGISFSFDKNSQLYCVSVNEEIPTSLEIKKGDSLEKIESIYGKDYIKHATELGTIYEYTFGNHYFRAVINDGKLTEWTVSKLKFSK